MEVGSTSAQSLSAAVPVISATLDKPWASCSSLSAAAACCCGPAGTCCVPANGSPTSNSTGDSTGSSKAPEVQAMVGLLPASQGHSFAVQAVLVAGPPAPLSSSLFLLCISADGLVHQLIVCSFLVQSVLSHPDICLLVQVVGIVLVFVAVIIAFFTFACLARRRRRAAARLDQSRSHVPPGQAVHAARSRELCWLPASGLWSLHTACAAPTCSLGWTTGTVTEPFRSAGASTACCLPAAESWLPAAAVVSGACISACGLGCLPTQQSRDTSMHAACSRPSVCSQLSEGQSLLQGLCDHPASHAGLEVPTSALCRCPAPPPSVWLDAACPQLFCLQLFCPVAFGKLL